MTVSLNCTRCRKPGTGVYFVGMEALCSSCFHDDEDQSARDPDLRKAALDLLIAVSHPDVTAKPDQAYVVKKAMDALREALAK